MTNRAKFEEMLDRLINEDVDGAKALFHDIVVAKSREIYENMMDDDELEEADCEMDEAIGGDQTDDFLDDVEGDLNDDVYGPEDEGMDDMEGETDMEFGDLDDEGGDEPATKDDVLDIKDALEELKAEFEAMLAGESSEEDDEEELDLDMDLDMDSDEEESEDEDEDEDEEPKKESFVREYKEKVAPAKMGDHGANARSVVASKNDMGGTTKNIARNDTSLTGGTKGGLAKPSAKDMNTGNVNVPGGKAGAKSLKTVSKPQRGDNGQNTKSTVGA